MADYCEKCGEEITDKDWNEGEASSCGECGDNYCKDCESDNGDCCTDCGQWICFNCAVPCEVDNCDEWGCEDHFTKVKVINDNGTTEDLYLCDEHLKEYRQKGKIIED